MRQTLRNERLRRNLIGSTAGILLATGVFVMSTCVLVPAEEKSAASPASTGVEEKGKTSAKKAEDKDPKWKATRPDTSKPLEAADNSYCLVCHVNLEEEELVDIHLPVGVGCETCHGFSDDHSSDEDGLTAPEIMWSKERINPRCMTCHPREDMLKDKTAALSHRKLFQRWDKPKTAEPGEKYCVECHGEHRLRHRTRVWDKETGKLLKQSGGPAMDR